MAHRPADVRVEFRGDETAFAILSEIELVRLGKAGAAVDGITDVRARSGSRIGHVAHARGDGQGDGGVLERLRSGIREADRVVHLRARGHAGGRHQRRLALASCVHRLDQPLGAHLDAKWLRLRGCACHGQQQGAGNRRRIRVHGPQCAAIPDPVRFRGSLPV